MAYRLRLQTKKVISNEDFAKIQDEHKEMFEETPANPTHVYDGTFDFKEIVKPEEEEKK